MTMDFDPIDALTKPFSVITALHNVQLVDVRPGESGFDRLVVQLNGVTRELDGGGQWSEEWSRREVGRYGQLVPVPPIPRGAKQPPQGACYFRAYIEPSLRRLPELDDAKGNLGWRCDARPGGFLAPAHIIPGKDGDFIADQTVEVTVRVPPEFVRECSRVQLTPKQLLEGFIGDAAGIHNFVAHPRADGFGSNGSDERDRADDWIERAYGMNAVNLDELEAQKEEEEQRQLAREDFGNFLDDFIDAGGQEGELFKAVEALVEQQRNKEDGN